MHPSDSLVRYLNNCESDWYQTGCRDSCSPEDEDFDDLPDDMVLNKVQYLQNKWTDFD